MDTCFANDTHEIRIAIPAGQDVDMDVSGNASTCHGADIETEIETIAIVDSADVFFGQPGIAHQFDPVVFRQVFNARNVDFGGNHEVPVGIGEEVQKPEACFAAEDDEVGCLIARI